MLPSSNTSTSKKIPELPNTSESSENGVRREGIFTTTLGHIVTEILDMNISFMLPDGTQYKPFTTVGEVKEFFHISDDDLPSQPVGVLMDSFLLNLYRYTVRPQEVSILNPQKEFVRDFFEQNVWGMVENSDTVDTLILEIRQLGSMGIQK